MRPLVARLLTAWIIAQAPTSAHALDPEELDALVARPSIGLYKAYAEFKMARYDSAREIWSALAQAGVPLREADGPLRGSEDFGRFGDHARAAMFLLGSGSDLPSLHNPDYDFPDALIPVGARVFARVVLDVCGDG